jgi:hypothetical protein
LGPSKPVIIAFVSAQLGVHTSVGHIAANWLTGPSAFPNAAAVVSTTLVFTAVIVENILTNLFK